MLYSLPETVCVNGTEVAIRSDFRAILTIIAALNDPELSPLEKCAAAIRKFYPKHEALGDINEAIKQLEWFIACGNDEKRNAPILMDWQQDFPIIVAPVNRVLGYECRAREHVHWWTFISAYYEIGESTFATVVAIRKKRMQGKQLEPWEQEFYRDNAQLCRLKPQISEDEIREILGG